MTIRTIKSRSDPKIICGLLAKEVLADLDSQEAKPEDEFLINFIRLLDMYRFGTFKTRHPRGVLQRRPIHKRRVLSKGDTLPRVQESLRDAHITVFGEHMPPSEVADHVIDVLERRSSSEDSQPSKVELEQVRRFLVEFLRSLEQGN